MTVVILALISDNLPSSAVDEEYHGGSCTDLPGSILKMSPTTKHGIIGQLFRRLKRPFAVICLLWLSMIAPLATLTALLSGASFYAFWGISLWFVPAIFLLVLAVFRSRNQPFRWLVFQYLGISAVCFSAAISGAILSFFMADASAGIWAVALALVFCSWGIYSAHKIHSITLRITSPKIDKKLRLVQISDVHIGSRKPAFLQKVIDQVHTHSPDLLVITGDLVDENVSLSDLAPLASLTCPVLYCSGNHERYIDYAKALETIAAHGVRVLTDQSVELLGLRIIGVEDRQQSQEAVAALDQMGVSTAEMKSPLETYVHKTSPFTVLLYHQPDIWDAAKRHGIELMLSGHTHKGQVWPFGLLVRTRYAHVAGHFQASLSHLFVSQGTGTWGPIMRFGTRCEMTVIDLQSV